MKCEYCNEEHNGSYKTGRFCSEKCARGFSTKAKRKEINETVSKKLTKAPYLKICPYCKKEFQSKRGKKVFCSVSCGSLNTQSKKENRDKLRNAQLKLIENGTHQGWKTRTKDPSYPEKYFISLFEKENIKGWEREYPIGKFFIDFAFIKQKLALEIDGKQHEERKEKDKIKDNFLEKNNWKVFRIKWYNPINENNKEKLYDQINEFKLWIRLKE
jgi:very-short-patch-repair endonuclease